MHFLQYYYYYYILYYIYYKFIYAHIGPHKLSLTLFIFDLSPFLSLYFLVLLKCM